MSKPDTSPRDQGDAVLARPFSEVRIDALKRWSLERVDASGEAWECRWQEASRSLHHAHTSPNCTETHTSLYCSWNDSAEQMVDLLTDERLDDLLLGTDIDLLVVPDPDSLDSDTNSLFRYYVRILWAAEVLLDDLQAILKLATVGGQAKSLRRSLSQSAPLDVDTLRAFTSHVGKHGAQAADRIHCWNHHARFFFEDAQPEPNHLRGCTALTARATPARDAPLDAVLMPKLADIVGTVAVALRNADGQINQPSILAAVAAEYGSCWPR